MSGHVRIALAQCAFPVGAVAANAERVRQQVVLARDEQAADLVVFPELTLSGAGAGDLFARSDFLAACEQAIQKVAAESGDITTVLGWPQHVGEHRFNALTALHQGRIVATRRRQYLEYDADLGMHRYFAQDGHDAPACIEIRGCQVGFLQGHDAQVPSALEALAQAGARLVVIADARPFRHGCDEQRRELWSQRAREAGLALAWVNAVGGQDELVFDGGALLVDADGFVHPAAEHFADHLLTADFDPESGRFSPRHWPQDQHSEPESLAWRALVRGLRDYLGTTGFQRVWVALSGGLDSALVLALAVDAIGAANVTAVALPSRHTAALSNDLALLQAQTLGVTLHSLSIEGPFSAFLDTLAPLFAGRDLDVTEENLQSRCRGVLMMALSNKFGGLLLNTSNKSELAVGYGTIYGDSCGGFAPIKDIFKTDAFALCRWRNVQGDGERIPAAVIARPPSAELRADQRDEDSLPPYPVLDAILRGYLEQARSRADLVEAGFDAATVDRVLQLIRRAEWKRRQGALGPDLSGFAFGQARHWPVSHGWRD